MHLVQALRQSLPDAVIGFVCNERTKDLVRMNRSIDRTFVFHRDLLRRAWRRSPFLFLKTLTSFLGLVRSEHFDMLVDLSLGREYAFFSMLVGIKNRIGFDFKNRGIFLTRKNKIDGYSNQKVADIQLGLLALMDVMPPKNVSQLSMTVSESARLEAEHLFRKNNVTPQDKILAVAPGGGRSWGPNAIYKQWDAERFAESVNQFTANNGPFKILLLGDKTERELEESSARTQTRF